MRSSNLNANIAPIHESDLIVVEMRTGNIRERNAFAFPDGGILETMPAADIHQNGIKRRIEVLTEKPSRTLAQFNRLR